MKLGSVMQHSFSQVPRAEIPRSSFNRDHGYKTTMDAGYLVPIYVDEALPGDTFSLSLTAFARMTTPLRPVMDNLTMDFFFFAVPIRLLWDNWQHFNGEQVPGSLDPVGSTDFICPIMTSPVGGYLEGSLSDYFGLPTKVAALDHVSFWHRGYNLIYNEWFRDQNLQQVVVVDKDDGPDDPADYSLLRRGKRHDYFTSCLPWPQKGDSVDLPLGTTAPLSGDGTSVATFTPDDIAFRTAAFGGGSAQNLSVTGGNSVISDAASVGVHGRLEGTQTLAYNTIASHMTADLSTATAATINQLRQAFQVQKLYERDARGGTRYTEILRAHFGVTSPDQRLQRPEYLGGGSVPLVANVSSNQESAAAAANLGFGAATAGAWPTQVQAVATNVGFTKSFVEHCVLIGLASIRADLTYQQGMLRQWSRSTRWDFYWPALAHIGEQAVLSKEIFADASGSDEDVFGYQERFAEYRYKPSQVTGLFRSNATGSLDLWHLSQEFSPRPTLSAGFIVDNPPIDRVVAVPSEPDFIYDSFIRLRTARPMPVFGVPGMIDHF